MGRTGFICQAGGGGINVSAGQVSQTLGSAGSRLLPGWVKRHTTLLKLHSMLIMFSQMATKHFLLCVINDQQPLGSSELF